MTKELVFRSKEQREQDSAAREVEEREEQRKKAAEPVNATPEGYPREETVEGTDGQPLIIKHISPARFEVWKDGKHINTFVSPDLLPARKRPQ